MIKKIKIKTENIILIMLALLSLSLGLWENFRQLWLLENNLDVNAISVVLSIGTFLCIFCIIIFAKLITLKRIKVFISFTLILKAISLMILFLLNGSSHIFLIKVFTIYDTILERLILLGIYPLMTTIRINDKLYGKRKLVEYLFRDLGIFVGGFLFGKIILGLDFSFNVLLFISIIFLILAFITTFYIKGEKRSEENNKKNILKLIWNDKIIFWYLVYLMLSNLSITLALGLKMLMMTEFFNYSVTYASNFFLIIGLISVVSGIIALKYFTPKNKYIAVSIKFITRIIIYAFVFFSNSMILALTAIIWTWFIATFYEDITDAPYINKIPNSEQLMFGNISAIVASIGDAIGLFLAGIAYEMGLKYIILFAGLFTIPQLIIMFKLIKMNEK